MRPLTPSTISIADLRRKARRRLPRMVFDYIDGGAEDELTMRENERVYDDVLLRPRSAVVVPKVDTSVSVLGHHLELPFLLAPVGSSRLFWPRGEAAAAAAAGKAGTIYTLSTLSGTRMEEVKEASTGPCWFQLYLCGGRDVALGGIARAAACGYSALVVTIDTAVAGMRERDLRNGTAQLLSRQPLAMLPHLPQILLRPRWLFDFFKDGGLMSFPNITLADGPMDYGDIAAQLEAAAVGWDDLRWIGEAWQGPIVVKGVHTADDARRAVDLGAKAVVVSNHGGRQLDGVAPTLKVLPEVVSAVGDRIEVLMDGGIRRGGDVVKALALGARAVLVGRAYAYGLGAGGESGVATSIEILRSEFVRTMKLLGCSSVAELSAEFIEQPAEWPSAWPGGHEADGQRNARARRAEAR
ncbi:MAG TPA: alpha-hydroxy acid oxidase [Trueperaceae bacterium]|nr:alpha-hydroxy acid oxidase [Trueperaceae bacterium]